MQVFPSFTTFAHKRMNKFTLTAFRPVFSVSPSLLPRMHQASVACVRVRAVQPSYQKPPLSPSSVQSHDALLHLDISGRDYSQLDQDILQLCGTRPCMKTRLVLTLSSTTIKHTDKSRTLKPPPPSILICFSLLLSHNF